MMSPTFRTFLLQTVNSLCQPISFVEPVTYKLRAFCERPSPIYREILFETLIDRVYDQPSVLEPVITNLRLLRRYFLYPRSQDFAAVIDFIEDLANVLLRSDLSLSPQQREDLEICAYAMDIFIDDEKCAFQQRTMDCMRSYPINAYLSTFHLSIHKLWSQIQPILCAMVAYAHELPQEEQKSSLLWVFSWFWNYRASWLQKACISINLFRLQRYLSKVEKGAPHERLSLASIPISLYTRYVRRAIRSKLRFIHKKGRTFIEE